MSQIDLQISQGEYALFSATIFVGLRALIAIFHFFWICDAYPQR
jgi:hypothetical protein